MNARLRALTLAVLATLFSPSAARAASGSEIRKVDFRNFSYTGFAATGLTTLKNGTFDTNDPQDPLFVTVRDIDHGDISGDGVDEAIVTLESNSGGTGRFTEARVFQMISGKPTQVAEFEVGDRADGGIDDMVIISGVAYIERYGTGEGGGACCPQTVTRIGYKLKQGTLVAVTKPDTRAVVFVSGPDPVGVKFLRGTSSAVLIIDPNATAFLDARKGQSLKVTVTGPDGTARLVFAGASLPAQSIKPGTSFTKTLPASGRYTMTGSAGGSAAYLRATVSIK